MIHNQKKLSNIEKMHYLKSHLSNNALKLIQHLNISDANYTAAWDILNARFNNKRLLVGNYLDLLLNQPICTHESASLLKQLHDTTQEMMHCLNNIGIETTNWDPVKVHILVKKLDKETHKMYEQSIINPREPQNLSSLLNFLELRFQTLESIYTIIN